MIKKVEAYMERHHMIEEGDTIVAGVSGGADSICLFYVLKEYCKKKRAELQVVHINHGIRQEASEDAEYVRRTCEEEGIAFHLYEKDVPSLAVQWGMGSEEAGRRVRYEAFEEIRAMFGQKGKIAVAHNRNDQAETMLFHLLRGSGLTGLTGIAPVRDGIIRPLLCVERTEIEDFLTRNQKKWCIDFTNAENTYTRNKLRNVVFPYVEQEVCTQSVGHMANTAEELALIKEYLDEQTDVVQEGVLFRESDVVSIEVEAFAGLHPVMKKQILLRALAHLIPSRKDFGLVHIKALLELFEKESGKQIHLPYRLTAIREFDRVSIGRMREEEIRSSMTVTIPGKVEPEEGKYMEFQVFSAEKLVQIEQKTYTKWFDYDKIINCLMVRNRKTGDYLTINAAGAHKTIKQYFIEEKVPRTKRDKMILLADGNHILWVVGMRISEAYKVTEHTKRILQVTFSE